MRLKEAHPGLDMCFEPKDVETFLSKAQAGTADLSGAGLPLRVVIEEEAVKAEAHLLFGNLIVAIATAKDAEQKELWGGRLLVFCITRGGWQRWGLRQRILLDTPRYWRDDADRSAHLCRCVVQIMGG